MNSPSVEKPEVEGWRKFLSVEVMLFILSCCGGGLILYSDVKADIASLQEADAQQQVQNKERYESLKEGQVAIRRLVEQMLLLQSNDDHN